MRTVRTKVYKFSELSKSAQESAIDNYRNREQYNQDYYDEITASVKEVIEMFDLKTGREYTDIRTSHIDDNILELSGVRLYKYIVNNYYNKLFKPAYVKIISRPVKWKQFICEISKGINGEYTIIYSRQKTTNSCTLTGMCYDDDILQPVYDFLAVPTKSTTFEDLMKGIESAISKTYDNCEEWLNSDDFIKGEIEANEYEFTKEGNRF